MINNIPTLAPIAYPTTPTRHQHYPTLQISVYVLVFSDYKPNVPTITFTNKPKKHYYSNSFLTVIPTETNLLR